MAKVYNYNNIGMEPKVVPVKAFSWQATKNLAGLSNLKDFSFNIRTLGQGQYSYPYHYHHNAEEMIIIVKGQAELRTPEGVQTLKEGDIVFFEKGDKAAHQLRNSQEIPCTYLDLRSLHDLDVCEYPDSGKVNILPQLDIFQRGDSQKYFDGEMDVKSIEEKWKTKD